MRRLILFLFLIQTTPAWGLIWIEPYLLFNLVGFGDEIDQSGEIKEYEYNTLLYGGRAGVSMFGFQLGPDFSKGLNVVRTETSGSVETNKHEKVDMGAFVGYRFDSFRVYYTQIISTHLTQKGGDNRLIHKGRGSTIGFGNIYDDTFSVNFEYRFLRYTDEEQTTGTNLGERQKPNPLTISEISVGISWVIDIFGGGSTKKTGPKK